MLDDTLIVWMGEFGRTPGDGNGHFSNAWSTMWAGGGINTGQVVGKTSEGGKQCRRHRSTERPISPAGLHRHALPGAGHRHPSGIPRPRQPSHALGGPCRSTYPGVAAMMVRIYLTKVQDAKSFLNVFRLCMRFWESSSWRRLPVRVCMPDKERRRRTSPPATPTRL